MNLLRTASAVALACLAVAGCGTGNDPERAPAPVASPTANPETSAPVRPGRPVASTSSGSVGLTVRYQAPDGSVQTLKVEDFRR